MKIRCTAASLHIEDIHFVGGIILEYPAELSCRFIVVKVLFQMIDQSLVIIIRNRISCFIILPEDIQQCRMFSVHIHITGSKVDRTRQGAVDTSQIDYQFTVYVQPEIIVTGEFENNIVPPVIQSIRCLGKAGFQFHTEIKVCSGRIIDQIQILILSWITVRQAFCSHRKKILSVHRSKTSRLNVVIREELPVLQGIRNLRVIGPKFFINREISIKTRSVISTCRSVKTGKILGTVILKIATGIIGAFNEKVIDLLRPLKKHTK